MDEVEKVAAAIRKHHVTRTLYTGPGKTKARRLHSGDLEAAQAAIAALDEARGDPVAKVVEYLRAAAKREDRIATDNRGTRLGSCSAYAALALKQEADAIEHGEHLK